MKMLLNTNRSAVSDSKYMKLCFNMLLFAHKKASTSSYDYKWEWVFQLKKGCFIYLHFA